MKKQRDFEHFWEYELDKELKRLPDLPAPDALAARVMEAVKARRALPWYQRPYYTWPRWGQWAALLGLLALLGGLAAFFYAGMPLGELGLLFSALDAAAQELSALAGGLELAVRAMLDMPLAGYALAIGGAVVLVYGTMLALGVAAWRWVHVKGGGNAAV